MKRVKIAAIVSILFALILLLVSCTYHKYEVEVTFCDKRPNRIYIIEGISPVDAAGGITTYKQAVPTWRGLYNVCEVKTIREVK